MVNQKIKTSYTPTGTRVAGGQNIVTNYTPPTKKSTEDRLIEHATRRQENRNIRDASVSKRYTQGEMDAFDEYDEAPEAPPPQGRTSKKQKAGAAPPKKTGGGIAGALAGGGRSILDLVQSVPEPTWIRGGMGTGSKKGKGLPGMGPGNLPDWVLTGRAPWDTPPKKQGPPVVKTVVTKVHADGTRTTSTRGPTQPKVPKRPNWIKY